MLTLDQCHQFVRNSSFDLNDLEITDPLTKEDLHVLSDFIKHTPLTSLTLSLKLTKEASYGLNNLAHAIKSNHKLEQLNFAIPKIAYEPKETNFLNPITIVQKLFTTSRYHDIQDRINSAMLIMLQNKPNLVKLSMDISETKPLNLPHGKSFSKSQSKNLSARLIACSKLKELDLALPLVEGAGINIATAKHPNNKLEKFGISSAYYGHSVLNDLQHTNHLNKLSIDWMSLNENDIAKLRSIIKNNSSTLTEVNLRRTFLTAAQMSLILEELTDCPNLKRINLSNNTLAQVSVPAICSMLSREKATLEELNLSSTLFDSKSTVSLVEALKNNTSLTKLVLDQNFVSNKGIKALCELLKSNPHITSLSLVNPIKGTCPEKSVNELCALLEDPNCTLKDLKFNNVLDSALLKKLVDSIDKNTSLESCNLFGTGILTNQNTLLADKVKEAVDRNKKAHIEAAKSPVKEPEASKADSSEPQQRAWPTVDSNSVPASTTMFNETVKPVTAEPAPQILKVA